MESETHVLALLAFTYRPLTAWALSLGILFSTSAHAIPTTFPKLRNGDVRLSLFGNSYLTKASESLSDAGTGNLGISLGARGEGQSGIFHYGGEAEGHYGLRQANYRYLDVPELYAGFENKKEASRFSLYLGRKHYDWSALDSYWSMGLYQPRFRWDYLNEREEGLTGLFAGFQSEFVQATAYFSPIVLPEQSAPYDISGGRCESSTPWFACPSSTILIFNQPTNVRFSLDIPPVKQLILHNGGGATFRLGRSQGFFGRASYAHKPMNQFLLAFEGRLDVSTKAVPAVIRPRVLYHHLFSGDFGWQNERHAVTGSYIAERPIRDATPANWNTQENSNATLYGITTRTQPFRAFQNTRFEFGFLRREGGVAPDQGPFVNPGVNYFEPRYAFRNAFSFAIFTPILDPWARRFLFSSKFILDTENNGNILVSDIYFSPLASLFLNLGLDILGSESVNPVDFISRYQRNDRLRGGIAYVF